MNDFKTVTWLGFYLLIIIIITSAIAESADFSEGSDLYDAHFHHQYATINLLKKTNNFENGMIKFIPYGLFKSLSAILNYWDNRYKRIIIVDKSWGFDKNEMQTYFYKLKLDVFVVEYNRISIRNQTDEEWVELLINYRFIILMCNDKINKLILKKANKPEIFKGFRNWVVYSKNVKKAISSLDIYSYFESDQSQFTVIEPKLNISRTHSTSNDDPLKHLKHSFVHLIKEVRIYDVFLHQKLKKAVWVHFASWIDSKGLVYLDLLNGKDKPIDGRPIRLTTLNFYPYNFLNENNTKEDGGIILDYFKSIEDRLGAVHKYYVVKDLSFGIEINGTFTGSTGDLQKGVADISGNPIGETISRNKVIRSLYMCAQGYIQMALATPEARIPPGIYLMPFSRNVWLTTFGGLITVLLFLAIVVLFNPTRGKTSSRKVLCWILKVEFLEEVFDDASGFATKAIHFTLLTATTLIFVYYSSVFTSFLTYKETKLPFDNLEEMVENKDYKIILVKLGKHQFSFEAATDGTFKRVWDKVLSEDKKGLVQTYHQGFYHMFTGKYVYVTDGPCTQYLAKGSCKVSFASAKYMKEYYPVGCRKDFPYARLYQMSLFKLWESGAVNRWEKKLLKHDNEACKDDQVSHRLGIPQVFSLFSALVAAYAIALMALMIELIVFRIYQSTAEPIFRI